MQRRRRHPLPQCGYCGRELVRQEHSWEHPLPNFCPTRERGRHGEAILRLNRIVDPDGRAASVFQAQGLLARMYDRGVLDLDQLTAGLIFRDRFRVASLDQLHALDTTRPVVHWTRETPISERAERVRDYCWSRLQACGGIASAPGSLLWGVVGLEMPISRWCTVRSLHGNRVTDRDARGILITVLDVLCVDTVSRIWRAPRYTGIAKPSPDLANGGAHAGLRRAMRFYCRAVEIAATRDRVGVSALATA